MFTAAPILALLAAGCVGSEGVGPDDGAIAYDETGSEHRDSLGFRVDLTQFDRLTVTFDCDEQACDLETVLRPIHPSLFNGPIARA